MTIRAQQLKALGPTASVIPLDFIAVRAGRISTFPTILTASAFNVMKREHASILAAKRAIAVKPSAIGIGAFSTKYSAGFFFDASVVGHLRHNRIMEPKDEALLKMTAQLGRIRVTQDNQAQIHRLVDDGLMQRDGDFHYCLTEAGKQSI
jgi:hypothetical protein